MTIYFLTSTMSEFRVTVNDDRTSTVERRSLMGIDFVDWMTCHDVGSLRIGERFAGVDVSGREMSTSAVIKILIDDQSVDSYDASSYTAAL